MTSAVFQVVSDQPWTLHELSPKKSFEHVEEPARTEFLYAPLGIGTAPQFGFLHSPKSETSLFLLQPLAVGQSWPNVAQRQGGEQQTQELFRVRTRKNIPDLDDL